MRRWEALADGCLDAGVLIVATSAAAEEASRAGLDRSSRLARSKRGIAAIARRARRAALAAAATRYTLADIAVGACSAGWNSAIRLEWRTVPDLAAAAAKLRRTLAHRRDRPGLDGRAPSFAATRAR